MDTQKKIIFTNSKTDAMVILLRAYMVAYIQSPGRPTADFIIPLYLQSGGVCMGIIDGNALYFRSCNDAKDYIREYFSLLNILI